MSYSKGVVLLSVLGLTFGCKDNKETINARLSCEISYTVCKASNGEGEDCLEERRVDSDSVNCVTIGSTTSLPNSDSRGAAAEAKNVEYCDSLVAECEQTCSDAADDSECRVGCRRESFAWRWETARRACFRGSGSGSSTIPVHSGPGSSGNIGNDSTDPVEGPIAFSNGRYSISRFFANPNGSFSSVATTLVYDNAGGMAADENDYIRVGLRTEVAGQNLFANVPVSYDLPDGFSEISLFSYSARDRAWVAGADFVAELSFDNNAASSNGSRQAFRPGAPQLISASDGNLAVGFSGGFQGVNGNVFTGIPGELAGLVASQGSTYAVFNDSEGAKLYADSDSPAFEWPGAEASAVTADAQRVVVTTAKGGCVINTFQRSRLDSPAETVLSDSCPTALLVGGVQLLAGGKGFSAFTLDDQDGWLLESGGGTLGGQAVQIEYPLLRGDASLDPYVYVLVKN